MVFNIGGARCTSFGAQMATRVLTAIFISPPIGNGSGVITELAEPEHRGKKLGWWTLMTTIGTPAGPFFMGFVVKHIGVQWIFWIYAMVNLCQFVVYFAIGDETIYNPYNERKVTGFWGKMVPRMIKSHSLQTKDIIMPFSLAQNPRVLIAACAHAITFCYANIAIVVEMPTAFGEKFDFDAQQIGLQFIAIMIGCVLGEQISGPMCDWFLGRVRRAKGNAYPADRLWLAYIAFCSIFAGLFIWGFQLQNATTWNVTPCVGAAIASFGNQMQTTILTTFAVESKQERASQVGIFVNVCRQFWGFVRFS
jgi:MFS family permease